VNTLTLHVVLAPHSDVCQRPDPQIMLAEELEVEADDHEALAEFLEYKVDEAGHIFLLHPRVATRR